MSEDSSTGDDASVDTDGGTDTVYAEIASDSSTAEYDLLEIIADLEGREIEELPSLYTEVGHFVETLFEVPPSPAAQMEIRFSYAGYRITIAQSGTVKLVPVKETLEE
jgi:hypothetical protein